MFMYILFVFFYLFPERASESDRLNAYICFHRKLNILTDRRGVYATISKQRDGYLMYFQIIIIYFSDFAPSIIEFQHHENKTYTFEFPVAYVQVW